jgi:mRNA-degrading endonuclease RelE of RelBE toxin-antitoxin system
MAIVLMTLEAERQVRRLPKSVQTRIQKLVVRLADWPAASGAKPLSGNLAGWFRLPTGDYRLRFHIVGDTVTIDKVGHRKDFYEY